MSETRWLAHHDVDGARAFRIGACGVDTLIAEWVGIGRLVTDRAGTSPRFEAEPDADPTALAKVRRGGAAMLVRQLRGGLAVHGASVCLEERGIVLTGESGAGKSTLAAWLVAQRGARLLSDDLTPIDAEASGCWHASPLETEHWLDGASVDVVTGTSGASADVKEAVPAMRLAASPAPLAAIVALEFVEASGQLLTRLDGIDALRIVLRQTVRFAIDEPERQRRELDTLLGLAGSVPFLRLTRPRDFSGLAASADRIEAWMRTAMVDTR